MLHFLAMIAVVANLGLWVISIKPPHQFALDLFCVTVAVILTFHTFHVLTLMDWEVL